MKQTIFKSGFLHCFHSTHPSSAELKKDVNVIRVLEETMKSDDLFVRFWLNSSFLPHGAMDGNFHRHLQTSEEKLGKIEDQNDFR